MALTAADRLRRLLAMLPWLAREGGATFRELAERFDLPEADVVTELEMAACCGLPPYSPDQLIELVLDDDRVEASFGGLLARPQRFTPDEGFALAASARALLSVPGADPTGALSRAVAKLDVALGGRAVVVQFDDPEVLPSAREAVARHETVEVDYLSASRDELSTRRVDPYVVFGREGRWYLGGWCHLAGGVRHFRLDRIQRWAPTGATFPPPASELTLAPDRFFGPSPETRSVTLVVPASARWIVETYPTLEVDEQADGRLRVALEVGSPAFLARLLLRLGPDAVVEAPADWRDLGINAARDVLARYR